VTGTATAATQVARTVARMRRQIIPSANRSNRPGESS
jgi:hypothetical protein